MVEYRVELSATAERQLRRLQARDQRRVVDVIHRLAREPRPRGCRQLHGYDGVYRVRSGAFRVIYRIEYDRVLIVLLKIGHRREIYR